ncbi:MAG: condensation domain-containing protein, partial [Candidatus Aminicenantes bacterium]|nr:condensation domain-containing protein [Candidatus Aminicenantes bacterium]
MGEIENRLLKHEKIKEVVVIANEEIVGDKYLAAYFVSNIELSVTELREYLLKHLPDYTIPAYFVQLEKIPLTPNGKINRRALPKPELKPGESYIAPRNEIEKKLAELWSDILDKDALHVSQSQAVIGINENFFHLGGHSLKATMLVSRIEKTFNVKIPLAEIFKNPRIRELSRYIKDAVQWKYEQIALAEKKEYYVLSSAQKRLHFLQQMDKDGTAYNISSAWILEGIVDKDKLEQSILRLILRHESLRTSFHMVGEEPVQRIHDEVEFEIEVLGGRDRESGVDRGDAALSAWAPFFIRPFDLSTAPLLQVGLVKLAEEKHILLVSMHHIISDGMSTQVMMHGFSTLYAGKELQEIKLHYKDYTEWQYRERVSKKILEQGEYWKKEFEGDIPVLELPTDYARPAVQGFEGNSINFEINKEISAALKTLASESGATLYIVLLALYTTFLSRITGQEDIVIGTAVAARRHADLEKIIGMFVNSLALRNFPSGKNFFTDFLEEVKEKTLRAFENQEYQYEDLVEQISINRDVGRNPLFDTMFVLQNTGSQKIEIPGLKLVPYEYEIKTAKFDLSLTCVEVEEKLRLTFEYRTKLFKRETVERFIAYFKNIIRSIVENKNRGICDLEILAEEEKKRILYEFNDTEAEYPKNKTIHQLFEEQVEQAPDRIAVIGSTTVETLHAMSLQITYRQLNRQSDRLAGLLIEKGVLADSIVGIMMERSVEMIVGIIGILKSGGAYLPIDPTYPQERIAYMLKDSNAKILLGMEECQKEIIVNCQLLIVNDKLLMGPPQAPFHHSSFIVHHSNHLAYINYTSGSTGVP